MPKMKLTPNHRLILNHMARGRLLMCDKSVGVYWLNGVLGDNPRQPGSYRRVGARTFAALRRKGYIELAHDRDDRETPWWRRDYKITDLGRQVLEGQTCDTTS